jgi:hypothetical protein
MVLSVQTWRMLEILARWCELSISTNTKKFLYYLRDCELLCTSIARVILLNGIMRNIKRQYCTSSTPLLSGHLLVSLTTLIPNDPETRGSFSCWLAPEHSAHVLLDHFVWHFIVSRALYITYIKQFVLSVRLKDL